MVVIQPLSTRLIKPNFCIVLNGYRTTLKLEIWSWRPVICLLTWQSGRWGRRLPDVYGEWNIFQRWTRNNWAALGNIIWICFTELLSLMRCVGILAANEATENGWHFLFLWERRFSTVWLDAFVGFVTSYILDVWGLNVCIWQDLYRGGPNTVVGDQRFDFCFERHRTHHGAQITGSKWWITKPNRVRFWIEFVAHHPWTLEEEIHLRMRHL